MLRTKLSHTSWRLLLVLSLSSLAARQGAAADLNVAAFGGIWDTALKKCYAAEFEKQTGKTVATSIGGPQQWLNQIAASPAHPPLDVVLTQLDIIGDAIDRKLIEPMTATEVPHLAELGADFVKAGRGYGGIVNYGAIGLLYSKVAIKTPPASWQDFVAGTIAGKWKASIPGISNPATAVHEVWWFSKLYGGGVDNVTPGIGKIKAMQDSKNLTFYIDPNQLMNGLMSGDVDIGMMWDGRAWAFIQDGHPEFAYITPAPGVTVNPILMNKVRNGNPLAWKFIDVAMSAGPQSCFANTILYGVANVHAQYAPNVAPHITPASELVWPPYEEAAPKVSAWVERWNKEIGN